MYKTREVESLLKSIFAREEPISKSEVNRFIDHYSRIDEVVRPSVECHFMVDYTSDRYVYISDSVEEISGYKPTDVMAEEFPFYSLLSSDCQETYAKRMYPDLRAFLDNHQDIQVTNLSLQSLLRLLHKDGREIPIIVQSQWLVADSLRRPLLSFGRVTEVVSIKPQEYLSIGIHDITDVGHNLIFQRFYGMSETVDQISMREQDILKGLVKGWSSKEMADKLHISMNTVNNHRRNLLGKLGLQNTADLVRYALMNAIY